MFQITIKGKSNARQIEFALRKLIQIIKQENNIAPPPFMQIVDLKYTNESNNETFENNSQPKLI